MQLMQIFKKKYNIIILIFIALCITLGFVAFMLNKKNKLVEGLIDDEGLRDLSASFQKQMADAGIPVVSPDQVTVFFDNIAAMATNEVTAAKTAAEARATAAANTPTGNTVAPIFPPTTFFEGDKFGDAFCKINRGNSTNLSNQCSTLTADNCNATDCCVFVNGVKCMAGDVNGPSTVNGTIDAEYYSYKYQCYGQCDSPLIVPSTKTPPTVVAAEETVAAPAAVIDECRADANSTTECINQAWAQLGCSSTWAKLTTNKGWYKIPDSLLGVDTTGKTLYLKRNSTQVIDATGQNMGAVSANLAAMVKKNPNVCFT
jgi:hypothetical protein